MLVSIGLIITCLLALLSLSLRDGTEYYKHVDEVTLDISSWRNRRVQLHGFVVAKSIFVNPNTLQYRFLVQYNGAVMQAEYQGIVPDTFVDNPGQESEVVLRGVVLPSGVFRVDTNGIMAKCPSKYTPV